MPHLDANALTSDVDGMEFLKDVLGVPAMAPLRSSFEPARTERRKKRARPVESSVDGPRHHKDAIVEAA